MVTKESIARDMTRLFIWYPLRWFIAILPIPLGFDIFRVLGKIHYYLSGGKREIIIRNMTLGLQGSTGEPPSRKLVQKYFETHYINQLLIFFFPRLNRNMITRHHIFRNLDKLDAALSRGRGCILVHPHFGPLHLSLFHLGLLGYNVNQVGYLRKPLGLSQIGEKVSFRLRKKYEAMIPARIIQGNEFLRPAFEHLRNNGILMMTGDGTGMGEFLGKFQAFPLLAQRMLFPLGPARLAQKTKSSLLAMFTIEDRKSNRYLTVIEDDVSDESVCEPEESTRNFAKLFESYLERYPGLWHFWDEFKDGGLLV